MIEKKIEIFFLQNSIFYRKNDKIPFLTLKSKSQPHRRHQDLMEPRGVGIALRNIYEGQARSWDNANVNRVKIKPKMTILWLQRIGGGKKKLSSQARRKKVVTRKIK